MPLPSAQRRRHPRLRPVRPLVQRSAYDSLVKGHHRLVKGAHDNVAREEPHNPDPLGAHVAQAVRHHDRHERHLSRGAQVHPLTREMAEPYFHHWERIRYVLATGWGVEDERIDLLLAALGNTLDFQTWHSLVRQQGLNDEQAVEVMVGMVRCLMSD
jgi:hypothetical protein